MTQREFTRMIEHAVELALIQRTHETSGAEVESLTGEIADRAWRDIEDEAEEIEGLFNPDKDPADDRKAVLIEYNRR